MPFSKSVSVAPRMVKCQTNISSSDGEAWYWSDGSIWSSRMSAWILRRDGDLDMAAVDCCYLVDDGWLMMVD